MIRNFAISALLIGSLASCGTTNDDGSVASGPLGQQPLMTLEVQAATQQALDACVSLLTSGSSLSSLEARGFVPWRGGYRRVIDNPLIIAGDSSVSAEYKYERCAVKAGPAYPVEIQTLQSLARNALAGRGDALDVSLGMSSDKLEVILK